MSQKQPLNFAQALRLKPVEKPAEQPPAEQPKSPLNWTPRLPEPEPQPPTPIAQETGRLDAQPPSEDENTYPSRTLRRKKSIRLPIHKLEKYEAYCFFQKIDFQDAVEKALDALVSGRLDAHILIDEKDEKATDEVLIYYQRTTGNRVTKKDEEAREEARGYSVAACKVGVLMSVLRSKSKINSFRYCLGAIEEAAAAPMGDLDGYLKFLEQSLRRKDANDR